MIIPYYLANLGMGGGSAGPSIEVSYRANPDRAYLVAITAPDPSKYETDCDGAYELAPPPHVSTPSTGNFLLESGSRHLLEDGSDWLLESGQPGSSAFNAYETDPNGAYLVVITVPNPSRYETDSDGAYQIPPLE